MADQMINDKYYFIRKADCEKVLADLTAGFLVYAPVKKVNFVDYESIDKNLIGKIIYNTPKPVSPLKTFFLPVKQNVVSEKKIEKETIIIGTPSCDLAALDLLDAIYLDEKLKDIRYEEKRNKTVLIATDCHSTNEFCHCLLYKVKPFPEKNHDILLSSTGEKFLFQVCSEKGKMFVEKLKLFRYLIPASIMELEDILAKRKVVRKELENKIYMLPDTVKSGQYIRKSLKETWLSYSANCVGCGACAAICPSCSCFLLIDRPEFEKVRQLDTCQYPAFERVAGGEDNLKELHSRFKNRYLCKYCWKPETFHVTACTGCGRCIEACIGKINKNELLLELAETVEI